MEAQAAAVPTTELTAEMTANISRPMPTPQPRIAMRASRRDLSKTLRSHMAGLPGDLAVALVVAQEDVFQAGFVAGQRHHRILRRRLDHGILPARYGQAQRAPIGQRLDALHAVQRFERLGWRGISKGDDDFVALDVLQLGHAADAYQLSFADDAHAAAHLLHLGKNVRRKQDSAARL